MTTHPTKKPRMPALEVRRIFDYDPDKGLLLWRERGFGRRVGSAACSWPGRHGYLYITLTVKTPRRHYLVAHLVWAWMHGRWPTGQIDHINRDKADNRLCNLRETTQSRNMVNKSPLKSSRSQRNGVKLDMRNGRYYPYLWVGNRNIYMGGYATADEAYEVRMAAEIAYYGEALSQKKDV